jgi:hypothetical protein
MRAETSYMWNISKDYAVKIFVFSFFIIPVHMDNDNLYDQVNYYY